MKKLIDLLKIGMTAFVFLGAVSISRAQVAGDYGSAGTGNWGTDGTNWLVFVAASDWHDATAAPGAPSSSTNVWIRGGHTVTAEASGKTCNNIIIQTGGMIITSGTEAANNITASGTLTLQGTGYWQQGGTGPFVAAASYSFSASSTFEFNGTEATSNCVFPNTTYGNFIWGNQANNGLQPAFALSIAGNLTIQNSGKIRGTGTAANYTHSVGGNVTVNEGTISNIGLTGVNAVNQTVVWNIGGDLIITSGKVSGLESAGATTTASSTFTISGNLSIGTNGTLQYGSNSANASPVVVNVAGNVTNSGVISKNSGGSGGTFIINFNGTSSPQSFSGTSPTASSSVVCDLKVNNINGVTLGSPLTLNQNWRVNLTNGKLTTSNTNLLTVSASAGAGFVGGSSSSFVNGPVATSTTGTLTYPVGAGTAYRPVTLGSIAGTSPVISVQVTNGSTGGTASTGLSSISPVRYWTIALVSGSFTSATVNLTYGADDGVTDNSHLNIGSFSGSTPAGAYISIGSSGSANGSGNITSNSVTSLGAPASPSFFVLANGTGGSNPLPVELTSFTGSANGRNVELVWNTATEINNSGFEVQRAMHSGLSGLMDWQKIGFVDGAGTSNVAHSYSFSDVSSAATTYSYRLKQIDHDGKFTYSSTVEVATTLSAEDFKLSQNYPNPFNPSTKFSFASKNAERTTVKIFNVVGQEVATLFNEVAQPNQIYTMTFDARNLPSGTYFYVLHSASRNEVRKMMLLK